MKVPLEGVEFSSRPISLSEELFLQGLNSLGVVARLIFYC